MSTAEDKTSEKMSAKRKRQPTTKEAEKSIDRESKKHREQAPTLDSPKGLAPTGKTYYPSLDSEEEEGNFLFYISFSVSPL